MSSGIPQELEEIISEIDMSDDGKPWLIIEGSTDYKFLATKVLPNEPKMIPVKGWENVDLIIKQVIEEDIDNNTYGFIDKDYREELGVSVSYPDVIVVSDYRDLEISMFESEALIKILNEFASSEKVPKNGTQIDVNHIRDKVYSIASMIGRVRYYIQDNSLGISLQEIDYSKFFNVESFRICNESLMVHLNSRKQNMKHKKTIQKEEIESAQTNTLPGTLLDNRFICCGHDVISVLGQTLKRKWGTNNGTTVNRENLEKLFRIGYPEHDFINTPMYKKLYTLLSS